MYNLNVKNFLKRHVFRLLHKFLSNRNFILKKKTEKYKIINFFRLIKPVVIQEGLIRVGGPNDGGYLIPNKLEDVNYCFSPGVSDNFSFEMDLFKNNDIKSFLADFSVENTFKEYKNIDFEKKFLGTKNSSKTTRLDTWINEKVSNNSELVLQMDIENSEWEILIDASLETLDRFKIMVIEFHNFGDYIIDTSSFFFVENLFKKLTQKFHIVHLHPNNCCGEIIYDEIAIPKVIEISFLNKKYSNISESKLIMPNKLDSKNIAEKSDITLRPLWDITL